MENQIRVLARKTLPPQIRRTLGTAAGNFQNKIISPVKGIIFDLFVRRFRADGCQFEIPRQLTSRTYRSCFLGNSYEAEERELIRKFIRGDDRVLEIGGCLGIVSCVTNKLIRDKQAHVVVEGNPHCIPAIHRNREINQCGFLVENCALSNQTDVTFYLHPVYIVGGSTQSESDRPVRVPGKSLGELDARYGPFSALIMDVEGAELESFEAAGNLLNKYRLVIVELHPWAIGEEKVERCREILRNAGFHFKQRAGITEAWERPEEHSKTA
ncbi:MAG: FkbM family methyltransferase [Verrucomicrobiota bacterium]